MIKLNDNKNNFFWKSFRIKKEYFLIMNLLKFHCISNDIDDSSIYNKIIIYGIDNIKRNNICYNFAGYYKKRIVKNFYLSENTYDNFNEFYNDYKKSKSFFKSELIELCIYLYVLNNFNDVEKSMVKFDKTDFGIYEMEN